ncbi:MAG: FtsW/RodA/SpoVE family cell cycle protein [Clostridia bacterium]
MKLYFQRADIFLLVLCLICAVISVIAVDHTTKWMASQGVQYIFPTKMVVVQVFSVFLGVAAFVVLTIIDPDILGEQWKWLVLMILLLLVALFIFGEDDGTGNKSWIRFLGIGIQPSEIIKILYIIISAKQMTALKQKGDVNSFFAVVQMAAVFGAVFLAIMVVSSDLGNAVILLAIFLVMFFALGVKLYWFAIGGAAVAAMIPLAWNYVLKDYQKKRLLAPYDESVDPDGWGIRWQTTQSKFTLASGRLTGADPGHRETVFTGKHTDFIFSSIGEMWGMIGCLIVLTLLLILIIHCFRAGIRAGRTYDTLLCVGIGAAIAFQTFINIGMCIGITPVIGIALPFFSYGGSSMVTLFGAMGIISGVKFKPKPERFIVQY